LRDDYSRFLKGQGNHSVKVGAVLSRLNYDVAKQLYGNPIFRFRSDISFDFPFEAQYGGGNPNLNAQNWELGFFAQDDWSPTPRLTINAGVRWDYESDMLDNNYVTPANVKAAVSSFVPPQYFTDGTQRPTYYGAIQPRIGFSYDLSGKGQTTLFAGYGRYFDRVLYNYTLDERFRLQYPIRVFRFSADGSPRDGQPTLVWQPQYLSKAGLNGVIASGQAGNPEVYLIDNNTSPPVSDQFTVGLRHTFGPLLASASYAGVRSRHGFTYIFGNRRPDGECCFAVPGFSNILLSSDTKKAWYDALFVTLEKPFTAASKWGMSLTYTLGKAEEIGGDSFSLDYPSVQAYPRHPTATDERNRIVATGIYQLPQGFRASAFITLSSGVGFTVIDDTQGFGINQRKILLYAGRPNETFAFQSIDLRVDKAFKISGHSQVELSAQVFNLFNHDNFTAYDGFEPPLPNVNANFGQPNTEDPKRRFQFGLNFRF
jgi:outer membrane receptor protein involved in Fe transport